MECGFILGLFNSLVFPINITVLTLVWSIFFKIYLIVGLRVSQCRDDLILVDLRICVGTGSRLKGRVWHGAEACVKQLLGLAHLVCCDWSVRGPREDQLLRREKCMHLVMWGEEEREGFILYKEMILVWPSFINIPKGAL